MKIMIHGSLFSGIGGFDLAAEWAGWRNAFNCEINPFCRRVLRYHFPDAEQIENIKGYDFTKYRHKIDVISGGFPCQPFSLAGQRRGTEDNRYLWPQMLRAIQEIEPSWVVGENVFGLTTIDNGVVFEQVCTSLEDAGYDVQTYIIPACGVNAPHRRDRLWIVAHRVCGRGDYRRTVCGRQEENETERHRLQLQPDGYGKERAAADTAINRGDNGRGADCKRNAQRNQEWRKIRMAFDGYGKERNVADTVFKPMEGGTDGQGIWQKTGADSKRLRGWDNFPTAFPLLCGGDDGISRRLDTDAIHSFTQWRNESIKAFGNAIVPQVAYQIFSAINEYERNDAAYNAAEGWNNNNE